MMKIFSFLTKQQAAFSIEDRDKYLAEAAIYAKSIAQSVGKPAAERLYCPSFKNKPCGCIQTYLSHQGNFLFFKFLNCTAFCFYF